jgi:cytochrome c553
MRHAAAPRYPLEIPMHPARWGLTALTAASLACAAAAHAAGDPAAGKRKFYTCAGCHGIPNYNNVYPEYRVPKLGGQHPEYIVSALQEYKNGARTHPTMHAQASTLSDQDMADIAAFLAQAPKNEE